MRENLVIRKVSEKDKEKLFGWANDREVRRWSFNPDGIEYQDHLEWFSKNMADENHLMYIFDIFEESIGLVRLKKDFNHIVLSYLLELQVYFLDESNYNYPPNLHCDKILFLVFSRVVVFS